MARDLYRRGSGPWFFIAIIVLAFSLYSLAMAGVTANDCVEGQGREWELFPPGFECTGRPGFG